MKKKNKVCIGLFFHNEEEYLAKAIESILLQEYKDFTLVLLDDDSSDSSYKIAEKFKDSDNRIILIKNDRRTGYSESYRKTFNLIGKDAEYFAWASGHDLHDKYWLKDLVTALDEDETLAMAYPMNDRIDENDKIIKENDILYENLINSNALRLLNVLIHGKGFGNMIYGLFRSNYLLECGIYRKLLVADTVLIFEVLILGKIKQIKKILWHRRFYYFEKPKRKIIKKMINRQKKNMFSSQPSYINIPWPLVNSFFILIKWSLGKKRNLNHRILGLFCSIAYLMKYFKIRNM